MWTKGPPREFPCTLSTHGDMAEGGNGTPGEIWTLGDGKTESACLLWGYGYCCFGT